MKKNHELKIFAISKILYAVGSGGGGGGTHQVARAKQETAQKNEHEQKPEHREHSWVVAIKQKKQARTAPKKTVNT